MKKITIAFMSFLQILTIVSCTTGQEEQNYTTTTTKGTTTTSTTTSTSTATATESIPSDTNPSTGSDFNSAQTIYINLSNSEVSEDNSSWETISTSKTKLLSKSANVKFTTDDNEVSTNLIKIDISEVTQNTSIYLSGTLQSGGVKIQTNPEYETGVYLTDVSITSSNYPAIEITKGGATSLFLNGENTLIDGRSFGTGYGEEYSTSSSDTYEDDDGNIVSCTVSQKVQNEGSDSKGTLYSKGSLTICGDGSLTISQSYKHCIASKAYLTIENGTYNLTSNGKSGFYGDCGITVLDGEIEFNGTGEVSSSKFHKTHAFNVDDETYSDAFVKIQGGSLNLTSYNGKGITAPIIQIDDGEIIVNSTGVSGYTNDDRKTATYYDADGVKHTSESVTFAAEGIEGASSITINGGTIEVTANDDALNVSNTGGTFKMTDGKLYAYSSRGDGIDSNGNITISGGTVVSYAPTGSEDALDCGDNGYTVSISGGLVAGICGSSNGVNNLKASGNQHILYATGSSSSMSGRPGSSSSSSSSATYSNVLVSVSSTNKFCFTVPSSSFGLLVLSSPSFTSSSSSNYTVYPASTISGGEDFHGLYTTLPTVSSTGSSTSINVK